MKTIYLLLALILCPGLYAQNATKNSVLIRNVRIFDGKSAQTQEGHILVQDDLIKTISKGEITVGDEVRVIDGKGMFAMPGLIDAHVHLLFESVGQQQALFLDFAMLNFIAARAAEKQLLRGFTTVRDLGGGALTLARAIDMGLVTGPRVFASGAFISQTGGHGDFGFPTDVPRKIGGELSYAEKNGIVALADGADQVLLRAREQLRQGATQLKLMAGGGVSSNYDPLDVTQYTVEEFRAAAQAAKNWGTYVTVHAYTPDAVRTAIEGGVTCIDHGQLLDEPTMKLMAEKGIWLSIQPFLDDEDANPQPEGSANRAKQLEMSAGTDQAYILARKYGVKTAWGTDALFDPKQAVKQGKKLAKMKRWYSPLEILRMATYDNAQLLAMSGKRSPYQKGKLGELSEGAYADLILVDGNPLKDIDLVADPERNFKLIMKGGKIYKNTLTAD
ncbi:metal-dependent hydrolase family protein [Robiginitalea marina]|uniref:Amidohydrolase family protein n=1 Tax=Robiginitalea marina TaxID=2954105 RepID=A0ABT1AWH6_9FLAO|nr:amidohydrolase family protein [Robiginitalea marina]MCO5724049.1 amidohydrolase family protein [Robiginitalea marina]